MVVRLYLALLFFAAFFVGSAQDFSNKGKDFWLGYGYHQAMVVDNKQDLVLYFTSDVPATVKVEIASLGWSKTYQVNANSVTESDPMPKSGAQDSRLLTEGLYDAGIHITSDQPVVAYAHIYNQSVSGATLLFPVVTLGQDYYSLNFTQRSNATESNSWAYVVATEDNTAVEIIPSVKTLSHNAGESFIVNVNKGQIYNLMGTTMGNNGGDLTGTRIRSVSTGVTGCKKIAVFSGAGRLSVNCENSVTSSDNIIQQVFPRSAWGRKFLTVPTTLLPNNYFRIAVTDPSTVVKVDGVQLSGIVNGFYYDIVANMPKSIVADKPVMVAQYITSANEPVCGNNSNTAGDPEMIYLSPIEQTIDKITLNSTSHYNITSHYINVVIKSSSVNSFTIDGVNSSSKFVTHTGDGAYSYAALSVKQGSHTLKADSGFTAIAYGYGTLESYGYNAGTNLKDLNQYLSIQNEYAQVDYPATCKDAIFQFLITLPYKASSLTWNFNNNPAITPNQNITQNNPVPDSTFVRDGLNFYVFKLPAYYSIKTVGTYPVTITANNTSADGCNGQQILNFDLDVVAPPTTNFTFVQAGCASDTTFFTDASSGNGKSLVKWMWDFDDGTVDSVKNPHKAFAAPGTFDVKLTSVNNIGCATNTTKPVTIAPQPVALFNISGKTCVYNQITFTDASTIASGKIVKWYWNFGNGNSVINTTNAPVSATYDKEGDYTVSLVVENNSGCKSIVFQKTITIQSSPVADFSMVGACLPEAIVRFTNLTKPNDGSPLTYVWDFGDGSSSTEKKPTHTYTTTGPFNVVLKAFSANGCTSELTKVFNDVLPQPKAVFSFNPSVICLSDSVLFVDNSTAANNSNAAWNWDFGDGTTSMQQNPHKKYAADGTYTVSLYTNTVFQIGTTAFGCASDTVKKAVVIHKLPVAAFSITGSICEKQAFTITDQSKTQEGTLKNWHWSFGDGTASTRQNANPFTATYGKAGNYTASLVVENDKGCKSDSVKNTITVNPLPVTNFILPEVCINDPFATFTDSSYVPGSPNAALQYFWKFDEGNSATNTSIVQNPQYKYLIAGTHNVLHTSTSVATGCSSSITKPIIVNSAPIADFTVTNPTELCSNAAVDIQNNSTAVVGAITKIQIIWDANGDPATIETDNSPVAGKHYTHTFPSTATTTTYQVKMLAWSGATCVNEKTVSVVVHPAPDVVFATVDNICIGENAFQLSQARETTGVPGSFSFVGNGVSPTGLFTPSAAGAGESTVTYYYTSADGCKDSAAQKIVVVPNPTIDLPSQITVLEGGSVVLDPVITGNTVKYQWTPGTYLNNPAIRRPESNPAARITYTLTASTPEGCTGSDLVTVIIASAPSIPNAFSPNGDGINDVWNIQSLSSYANARIEVFNRYGQIVFTSIGYSTPWNGTFNGRPLPVGVYYYVINTRNGNKVYTGNVTILK